ncbi:MAG TPA: hypothetical protein VF977_08585 [Candidatus Binatia bacterium]
MSRIIALAIFLTGASTFLVQAQMEPGPGRDGQTQELVDQLKEVIRGVEQDRRSNPSMTKQLRDLVRRYDWPWRVALLHDDFRDGDYTYDPRWIVKQGEFRVVRSAGLRSFFDPSASGVYRTSDRGSDSPALELLGELLLGSRELAVGEIQSRLKSEAEIFTRVGITKGFALKLQLSIKNYVDRNTRLEFGPFQDEERSSGYRLAYESGRTPSLSLLRFESNRSAVIEMVDQGIVLEDGKPHTIEWRRGNDGEMVVLIDNKEVMRTVDRAYDDPFDGFALINKGGEFELKQVSIFGTQ